MIPNEIKMTMHTNRTLEEILQHFFNCKKPFNNNGEFTKSGSKAYGKLIELIYNVGNLCDVDVNNDIVEKLDNICDDEY